MGSPDYDGDNWMDDTYTFSVAEDTDGDDMVGDDAYISIEEEPSEARYDDDSEEYNDDTEEYDDEIEIQGDDEYDGKMEDDEVEDGAFVENDILMVADDEFADDLFPLNGVEDDFVPFDGGEEDDYVPDFIDGTMESIDPPSSPPDVEIENLTANNAIHKSALGWSLAILLLVFACLGIKKRLLNSTATPKKKSGTERRPLVVEMLGTVKSEAEIV